MRGSVATKTPEQQSCLTLHRTRHLFIRQREHLRKSLALSGLTASSYNEGATDE